MTQRELAKTLNITQAAVSMALKGSPRISPEVRESVRKLAENSGYRLNLAGQMLRRNRSNVIGTIFPRLTNLYYAELFQEIQQQLQPHGYILSLTPAETAEELHRAVANLQQMHVAGVISSAYQTEPLLPLKEAGIALVLCGGYKRVEIGASQILPDYHQPILMLTRRLIADGRRHIAFFGADIPEEQRYNAYLTVLQEAGLTPLPIFLPRSTASGYMDSAFDAVRHHLLEHPETDAIIAHHDELALVARRAILQTGRSIPQEVALTGFDNISLGRYITPSLTTVEQPKKEIAQAIIHELLESMRDPDHREFISLPCRLVIRGSI